MSSSSSYNPPAHNNVDLELVVDRAAPWFHNFGSSSALLVHMKRPGTTNDQHEPKADISKTYHHLSLQPCGDTSEGSSNNNSNRTNVSTLRDDSTMQDFSSSRNFRAMFSTNNNKASINGNMNGTAGHVGRTRRTKKNILHRWFHSITKL